jgi:predicted AlkP superfamily pyrophosphatase or phosphodiesterase
MRVTLFLIDAFKDDYLSKSNTPFLYQAAKKNVHIQQIIPSAGFCERTEIFFGLRPNQSGFFTAIGFDEKNGTYKNSVLVKVFSIIEGSLEIWSRLVPKKSKKKYSIICRKILLKFFIQLTKGKYPLKPYNIPFSFLKYFLLTEDSINWEKDKIIGNNYSLMEIVKQLGNETYLDAFTSLGSASNGSDEDRIRRAVRSADNPLIQFIPVYISSADSFGHRYGPNSIELSGKVNEIDTMLSKAVEAIKKTDPKMNFVYLGDHGMTEVTKKIDVGSILRDVAKKRGYSKGKDYIYFLDSTIMRIWFFNENCKNELSMELLNHPGLLKHGSVITNEIVEEFSLPKENRKYGDLTWWGNEGVLIFPDFFYSEKPVKGMHGYKPDSRSTYGTCIIEKESELRLQIENRYLHEVYSEIVKIMRT